MSTSPFDHPTRQQLARVDSYITDEHRRFLDYLVTLPDSIADVRVGMPESLVEDALGDPDYVATTITSAGTDHQLIYPDGNVYCHNNTVDAVEILP